MRHLRRLGHCLAAGALAGAVVAPLQLLLWPELTLRWPTALLALGLWASWAALWFGAVSFALVEVYALLAPQVALRRGFSLGLWSPLAAAHGTVVAAVAFYNRDRTYQLLGAESREGLRTIGLALLLFTLLVAVLGVARPRQRYARLWAACTSLALVATAWGVWATAPRAGAGAALPNELRFSTSRRLLLVSLEGTDLPWLLPAIERGDMPFLRTLRDEWAWGQLTTVSPFSRLAALTTLATGCAPATHGVTGRRAYRIPWLADAPVSLLLKGPWPTPHHLPWRLWQRAASPAPRRATIWEILLRAGRTVGLAGWPGVPAATWVLPTPLAAEALPYSQVDAELREALEPSLRARPEVAERTRNALAVSVQMAALTALRAAREPVDCLVFNTDLAARLRPLWRETDADPLGGTEVLRATARLLDEQLRELWLLAGGDDCLLVVVSPYGMAPPKPWRRLLNATLRRRSWTVSPSDSSEGFVLLAGGGVRRHVRLRNARLSDVVPTVLYLLELPVARDMAGRVALDAVDEEFASRIPLRLIPSHPPLHPPHPAGRQELPE